MCFSAGASFVGSGVLAGIGTAAVKQAKRFRLIALIPVFFAIQQFIEGLQWLSPHPSELSSLLGLAYLLFAFLLWPSYLPYATLSVEPNKKKQKVLKLLFVLGTVTSAYLFAVMLTQPLTVAVLPYGLAYQVHVPLEPFVAAWYAAVVSVSLIISSHAFIRLFGGLLLIFAALGNLYFFNTFVSFWCFFAAILSLLLWMGIRRAES